MRNRRLILPAAFLMLAATVARTQDGGSLHPRITTISDKGGRLDWGPSDLIAYDTLSDAKLFEVSVMRPDGSGARCLTCGRNELPPGGHRGNPAWDPTGKYILFQAEQSRQDRPMGMGRRMGGGGQMAKMLDFAARPGAGYRNDLWLMDAEGQHFWKLVATDPQKGAILHPHFSPKGDKIFWTERNGAGGFWGHWQIKIGDFGFAGGAPKVTNIKSYEPTKGNFYEIHDVDKSGNEFLITGDPESGPETALDIYRFNAATGKIVNLTHSPDTWDEHAHYSPSGKVIVWMSSKGQHLPNSKGEMAGLKTDFWMMNADGGDPRQVTFFNSPGHKEAVAGSASCADSSWSPDGSKFAGYVQTNPVAGEGRIVVVDFGHPM